MKHKTAQTAQPSQDEPVTFSVRIRPSTIRALEKLAKAQEPPTTRTNLIRFHLERLVKKGILTSC